MTEHVHTQGTSHTHGPDGLQLLESEHREAEKLFKKLEKAGQSTEAVEIWVQLQQALTTHEKMEETYLYPPLKEENRTEDLVLEAYQEHHVMDVLIKEISKLTPVDEEWAPKIKVLQENVEHHVKEEETDLFPKVRKMWSATRREQVGEEMATLKAKTIH